MRTKILMIMVVMGLSAVVIAQRPDRGSRKSFRGPDREMRMNYQQRDSGSVMKLTDEQKEAFKQSRLALQKQLQPLQNELGELQARRRTLMTAEKPDRGEIEKNIEKMGEVKVEMEKIQVSHRLEMREKLTEEQRLFFDNQQGKMMQQKGFQGPRQGRGMQKWQPRR